MIKMATNADGASDNEKLEMRNNKLISKKRCNCGGQKASLSFIFFYLHAYFLSISQKNLFRHGGGRVVVWLVVSIAQVDRVVR